MAKLNDKQKEALVAEALEKKDNGKSKYTQQFLADKYGISKGMVNRYVKEKVNISQEIVNKEVRIIGEMYEIEELKSKHLSKQEQIEVNKQVQDRTKSLMYYQDSAYENQVHNMDALSAIKRKKEALKKQEDKDEFSIECLPVLRENATITKINKEVHFGKDPETQVNIQNNNTQDNKQLTINELYD